MDYQDIPLDLTSPSKRIPLNTVLETDSTPEDLAFSPFVSTSMATPLLNLTEDMTWESPDVNTTVEYEELKEAEKSSLNLLKAMGEQMCMWDSSGIQWETDKDSGPTVNWEEEECDRTVDYNDDSISSLFANQST